MTPHYQGIAGGEHTLYKSKDGSLQSTGACGLGWCRLQSLNPTLFKFRPVQIPEPISLVHASYYHNLAVGKKSGSLYSWGCGTFVEGALDGVIPALAQGRHAQDIGAMPEVVNLNLEKTKMKILAVTGGAYHSAILLSTGRILTFGAGQLGQLGRPIPGTEAGAAERESDFESGDASGLPVDPIPAMAEIPKYFDQLKATTGTQAQEPLIKKIGAGFYNTFAICQRGKLFCTGENQNQQCGIGSAGNHTSTHHDEYEHRKNILSLTQVIEVDDQVVDQVDGGYCHTLVKAISGKVFSLGCGDDGQRGDGRKEEDYDDDDNNEVISNVPTYRRPIVTPVHLPGEVFAKEIAAGANHSVILGSDGNAYSFGANDVGQCGVYSDDPLPAIVGDDDDDDEGLPPTTVLAPKKVDLPEKAGKVIHVSAGYAHTILTTDSGNIFAFGQGDNGQLGIGFGGGRIENDEEGVGDIEAQRSPVEVNVSSDDNNML